MRPCSSVLPAPTPRLPGWDIDRRWRPPALRARGTARPRAQLQESLETRAGVFGPTTLIPVRKEQHEPAPLAPLRPLRRDELVDDWLRNVHKVPVLRFPQHQVARRRNAEAVLETHHCRF